MRIFFDTEFIEYPNTIDLISIGMVRQDGKELYMISSEFDASKADEWVVENVLNQIGEDEPRHTMAEIKNAVREFVGDHDKLQFWANHSGFDWVVFCWIFGAMVDLPEGYPTYCNDIKQLEVQLGEPELPPQAEGRHNALEDAKYNAEIYKFLMDIHGDFISEIKW